MGLFEKLQQALIPSCLVPGPEGVKAGGSGLENESAIKEVVEV